MGTTIRCECGKEFKDDRNTWSKNFRSADDKYDKHIQNVLNRMHIKHFPKARIIKNPALRNST